MLSFEWRGSWIAHDALAKPGKLILPIGKLNVKGEVGAVPVDSNENLWTPVVRLQKIQEPRNAGNRLAINRNNDVPDMDSGGFGGRFFLNAFHEKPGRRIQNKGFNANQQLLILR
jgi:hypothetical protein